jgi:hypothetical protein
VLLSVFVVGGRIDQGQEEIEAGERLPKNLPSPVVSDHARLC